MSVARDREAGIAALEGGDPLGAAGLLRAAAAAAPEDAGTWLALSRALLETADLAEAREAAERGSALDPGSIAAALQRAAAEQRLGDAEAAGRTLEAFAERRADDPAALERILERLLAIRDWPRAGSVATRLLALRPGDEAAVFALAAARQAEGDEAAAREIASRAGPEVAIRIGILLLLAARRPREAWARVQAVPDAVLGPLPVARVADALLHAGHLTAAETAAGRALLLDRENWWAAAIRERAQGLLAALHGRIPDPGIPRRAWEPIPDRALLVTEGSLPYNVNGGIMRTQRIAGALAREGIEEHVATALGYPWVRGRLAAPPEETVDGVRYHRLLPPGVRWDAGRGIDLPALQAAIPAREDAWIAMTAGRVAELAALVRPAVIHATRHPRFAEAAAIAARALDLPMVYEVRDWCERGWGVGDDPREADSEQARLLVAWDARRMAAADRVAVLTGAMREEAESRGVPGERITVAPLSVDTAVLRAMEPDGRLLADLAIPPGNVVIGHLSALAVWEGIEDLVDACAELIAEGSPITLVVVGEHPRRIAHEARAKTSGIADAVRFVGRVEPGELSRWYSIMDIIAIPRRANAATLTLEPSKLGEAMATGRPVVASGVPPIRAVIRHGETGVLTPPGDPKGLARALADLVGDPARRARIGGAGREWVAEHRALPDVARTLAGVLRETASGTAPGAQATGGRAIRAGRRREPARILHFVAQTNPWRVSGSTVRTGEVVRWQRNAGIDPHVATTIGYPWSGPAGRAPLFERVDGIPHYRLAPGAGPWPRDAWLDRERVLAEIPADASERAAMEQALLARLIAEIRPQAVHGATSVDAMAAAAEAGRAAGLPVILEIRGFHDYMWLTSDRRLTREDAEFARIREKATSLMLGADRVVTLSEGMAAEAASRGVPPSRIAVVPNGVDAERFRSRPPDRELAARAGIPPGALVVGSITTLSRWEGLEALLEAVALLRREGLPASALIVGEGEMGPRLRQRATELGLGAAAVLPGSVPWPDVPGWMSLIDIFALPRTESPYTRLVPSLKALEAMAMERPVIFSDLPVVREMVIEGVTGEFMRPGDAQSLAAVAERLLRDPERRRTMGEAGRAWVTANRAWRDLGLRYLDLYREMGLDMTPGNRA